MTSKLPAAMTRIRLGSLIGRYHVIYIMDRRIKAGVRRRFPRRVDGLPMPRHFAAQTMRAGEQAMEMNK
jgi:hypothetical protein